MINFFLQQGIRNWFKLSQRQLGFSLIEIMLVVFIVGMLAAGVSVLATRDNGVSQITKHTRALQETLLHFQSEAMLKRQYFGLILHEKGWRVMQIKTDADFLTWGFDPGTTIPTVADEPVRDSKELPWVVVEGNRSTYSVPSTIAMALFFEGSSVSKLAIDTNEPPQVVISAQGEVTPFQLRFRGENRMEVLVDVHEDGRLVNVEAEKK